MIPIVSFCKTNIEELSETLTGFNHYKISEEIDVCDFLCPDDFEPCSRTDIRTYTSNELDLIIQIPNFQLPILRNSQNNNISTTLLILHKINTIVGEDLIYNLTTILDTDPTIYSKLSDLVSIHLSYFPNVNNECLKSLYLKIWALQLTYSIIEEIRYNLHPHSLTKYKQDDIKKIRVLANNLKENIKINSPSLGGMAVSVEMSPTKFKNIFKDIIGETPHQFIINLRLDYALTLLKKHDLTISQIAYKVGFNHPSSFSRLFKNKFGVSPNEIDKTQRI